jgi:predicted NACHT family NTPase
VKDKDNILKYLQEALPKCEIDFFKEKDIWKWSTQMWNKFLRRKL